LPNLSDKYPNNSATKDTGKSISNVFQLECSAGRFGSIIENKEKSAEPEM